METRTTPNRRKRPSLPTRTTETTRPRRRSSGSAARRARRLCASGSGGTQNAHAPGVRDANRTFAARCARRLRTVRARAAHAHQTRRFRAEAPAGRAGAGDERLRRGRRRRARSRRRRRVAAAGDALARGVHRVVLRRLAVLPDARPGARVARAVRASRRPRRSAATPRTRRSRSRSRRTPPPRREARATRRRTTASMLATSTQNRARPPPASRWSAFGPSRGASRRFRRLSPASRTTTTRARHRGSASSERTARSAGTRYGKRRATFTDRPRPVSRSRTRTREPPPFSKPRARRCVTSCSSQTRAGWRWRAARASRSPGARTRLCSFRKTTFRKTKTRKPSRRVSRQNPEFVSATSRACTRRWARASPPSSSRSEGALPVPSGW